MNIIKLLAMSGILSFLAFVPQDQKESAAWKALGATVPNHKYPQKGRYQRAPEPNYADQVKKLDATLETTKGTSAEPHTLFYKGNALFQLEKFADALAVFEDLKARFPNHGLVKATWQPEPTGKSAVDIAIDDCKSEIEIRKVYEVKRLPTAVLDEGPKAIIHTSKGDFTIKFYKGVCPETTANFKKLVQSGQFVDTYFHQVVTMQRVLGGCPNTKKDNRPRDDDGTGSLGYDLPLELSTAMHSPGAISMQRIHGKDRASSCQFTICLLDQPDLNSTQAVFGQVTEGLDNLKRISQERADDVGNPYEHVWIVGTEWIE